MVLILIYIAIDSSFQCMVSNGKHFAVVRVYQSSGHTDPNGPATINDAWAGECHMLMDIFSLAIPVGMLLNRYMIVFCVTTLDFPQDV